MILNTSTTQPCARIGRIAGILPATVTTNYFVIDYTDGLKRPLAETRCIGNHHPLLRLGSQLLCHIEANGDVRYYHSDELGSTLALTDPNGVVTDQFAYMPYGLCYAYGFRGNTVPVARRLWRFLRLGHRSPPDSSSGILLFHETFHPSRSARPRRRSQRLHVGEYESARNSSTRTGFVRTQSVNKCGMEPSRFSLLDMIG